MRVRMFQRRCTRLALDDFHRQEIGENGQGIVKRTTLVVAGNEPRGFNHFSSPGSRILQAGISKITFLCRRTQEAVKSPASKLSSKSPDRRKHPDRITVAHRFAASG